MYTNAIGELVVKTQAVNVSERVEQSTGGFSKTLSKYTRDEETGVRQTAREDERKNRQRKVIELRSRIAELKSQITEPGISDYLETEISLLQMEMFWLMTKI